MKRFTLLAAFVSLLAMTGMDSGSGAKLRRR